MSPNVTGLQTDAAGQPILDPADNRYFLANTDGERKRPDGDAGDRRRQYRPAARAARLRQPHRRISLPRADQPRRLRPPAQLHPADRDDVRPARADLRPARVPVRRSRDRATTTASSTPAIDVGAGLGALRVRLLRPSQRRSAPPTAASRTTPPTATASALAPNQTPTNANFVPLTPNGFLPLIDTDLEDYAGTVGIRGELARLERRSVGRPRPQQLRLSGPRHAQHLVRHRTARATSTPAGCATARTSSTSICRANMRSASPSRCRSRPAPNIATRISRSGPGDLQS